MQSTRSNAARQRGGEHGVLRFDALRRRFIKGTAALAGALALAMPFAAPAQPQMGPETDSVVTWGVPIVSANPSNNNRVNNQTLRQVTRISIGGTRVRVKFSNRWNPMPLEIGGAQVAVRTTGNGIDPATSRPLTFSGNATFVMPPFSELMSDWVDLVVPDFADLTVDAYIPGDTSATGTVLSVRNGANQTNYVSSAGNFVGSTEFPQASTRNTWTFLASIDVVAPGNQGAVIALGDSITEGLGSTLNTNGRWPDVLARRLLPNVRVGVSNVGISGNRVAQGGGSTNPSALARFDRDVIAQTGAKWVIMLLGINDANGGTSAEDIIAAMKQVAIRARSQQMKIFIGTITPFGNGNAAVQARRATINQWIRTTREIDGFVEFDIPMRDPNNPLRLRDGLHIGDQLHPNNAGYEVMGNAVNLEILR